MRMPRLQQGARSPALNVAIPKSASLAPMLQHVMPSVVNILAQGRRHQDPNAPRNQRDMDDDKGNNNAAPEPLPGKRGRTFTSVGLGCGCGGHQRLYCHQCACD